MRWLVTGSNGFIGSHFVDHVLWLNNLDQIWAVDARIEGFARDQFDESERLTQIFDRCQSPDLDLVGIIRSNKIDVVVHFAATSHVDQSIATPDSVALNNIEAILAVLEAVRKADNKPLLVYISTDEVYGSWKPGNPEGGFHEDSTLNPGNPYSASKAAGEHLVRSYANTFGIRYLIFRPCNNFGPYQHPSKFVAKAICYIILGKKIPIYADGQNSRQWIGVQNCVHQIYALAYGKSGHGDTLGETFNISSHWSASNMGLVNILLDMFGHKKSQENHIEFVEDRLGHDFEYRIDASRALYRLLSDVFTSSFYPNIRLKETITWYQSNRDWWEPRLKGF